MLFGFFSTLLFGQEDPVISLISNNWDYPDSLMPFEAEEYLIALRQVPLNINTATENDFSRFPFLSLATIRKILQYRAQAKHIFSPAELFLIPEVDTTGIRQLIPFITFANQPEPKGRTASDRDIYLDRANGSVSWRLINTVFAGPTASNTQLSSFKVRANMQQNYEVGLVLNHFEQRSLRDFSSIYLIISALPGIEKLIIGDYRLNFGSGLVYGKYFRMTNAYNPNATLLQSTGTSDPNIPLSSNQLMRGFTASINLAPAICLIPFFSVRSIAGSTDTSGIVTLSERQLRNVYNDLTAKEQNTVTETTGGCMVNTALMRNLSWSGLFVCNHYDKTVSMHDGYRLNETMFSMSLFYQAELFCIATETAFIQQTVPYRLTTSVTPSQSFSFTYSLSNFPSYSTGAYSNRDDGGIDNNFSAGSLFAMRYNTRGTTVSSYFAQYTKNDEARNLDGLRRNEYYLRIEHAFTGQIQGKCYYKKNDGDFAPSTAAATAIENKIDQVIGCGFTVSVSKKIKFQFALFDHEHRENEIRSTGLGQIAGITLSPSPTLQLYLSFCAYRTNSTASAVAFYEAGIPGIPSTASLTGDGYRTAAAVHWKPLQRFEFDLKYWLQNGGLTSVKEINHIECRCNYLF
jgi:hypothetical protein